MTNVLRQWLLSEAAKRNDAELFLRIQRCADTELQSIQLPPLPEKQTAFHATIRGGLIIVTPKD